MTTLIVVDVQADFCEGGPLACKAGWRTARKISRWIASNPYDSVIASRDWHDPDSSNGGHISDEPDFVDTWPQHCVRGTEGSEYAFTNDKQVPITHVVKGLGVPAYSVMEGSYADGFGNVSDLSWDGVDIEVCGIATDYCVKATVLDFLEAGANVTVLEDLCAPVSYEGHEAAIKEMQEAGATIR